MTDNPHPVNGSAGSIALIAHRGYASRYPENSLESLRAALERGVSQLEFDVQVTADGVPVLLHDPDLRRTAGLDVQIQDSLFATTRSWSVHEPARLGQAFAPTAMPSLDDAVDLLQAWPDARAFVELKRHSLESAGRGPVVEAVMAALQPIRDRACIISFDALALAYARAAHQVPIGWVLREWDAYHRHIASWLQPTILFCNVNRLPAEPAALWQGDWEWAIYEITDADTARALYKRGVRHIETMAVGEMLDALAKAA